MSWRRELGTYFGLGDRGSLERNVWLATVVGVAPVLLLAFVLSGLLGFDDDFLGFLATIGLVIVLAPLWALVLRAARSRRDR